MVMSKSFLIETKEKVTLTTEHTLSTVDNHTNTQFRFRMLWKIFILAFFTSMVMSKSYLIETKDDKAADYTIHGDDYKDVAAHEEGADYAENGAVKGEDYMAVAADEEGEDYAENGAVKDGVEYSADYSFHM